MDGRLHIRFDNLGRVQVHRLNDTLMLLLGPPVSAGRHQILAFLHQLRCIHDFLVVLELKLQLMHHRLLDGVELVSHETESIYLLLLGQGIRGLHRGDSVLDQEPAVVMVLGFYYVFVRPQFIHAVHDIFRSDNLLDEFLDLRQLE